jgi:predicted negative regulator of RcsB-dependent stress response
LDKQLRDQIKHDKFVEEVGHTFEYLSEHKSAVQKYGMIGAAVVLVIVAAWGYIGWQRSSRQDALRAAQAVMEASVGDQQQGPGLHFKTKAEKEEAALKALTEVGSKHSGSREGLLAMLQAASIYCDQGREADCEKALQQVANGSDAEVASLGKLSLATYYNSKGNTAQAETLLRQLVDRPTSMVSKEQAQITLARTIGATKRDEAKKILEGLQGSNRSPVSRAAVTAMGELMANQK